MQTHPSHAAVALLLIAGTTGAANAQTVYTRDWGGPAVVAGQPLQLTPAQRTTIFRTIIPQGRGRAPIVKERIVTEPILPAPVVREQVGRPLDDYAYGGYDVRYDNRYDYGNDYAFVPNAPRRAVTGPYGDYAYAVGTRVPGTVRLNPLPQAVVAQVPAVQSYRYFVFNGRVLLIDPADGTVVADVTGY
jgi:hypothetical protein